MLQTVRNAFKIPELRRKLLFVGLILLLYRIGAVIPVPFVDSTQMGAYFESLGSGSIFNYLDILAGGAFSNATLFALSVSPYITSSIVLQLLDVAFPSLFGGKEGRNADPEFKRKRMTVGTRITTIILAVLTSTGYYMIMRNNKVLSDAAMGTYVDGSYVMNATSWLCAIVIITSYCAGAALIMWMAEKIEEKGIGNGISMILLVNILASLTSTGKQFYSFIYNGFHLGNGEFSVGWGICNILLSLLSIAITIAIVVFVIWITGSERRIPVTYAKRVVGRKMYGGQKQNLPLKVNMAGVMPIIFASSIVSLPATIIGFMGLSSLSSTEAAKHPVANFFNNAFSITGSPWNIIYMVLMFLLIIAFSYFYILISFDPVEVANNLQKQGGQIAGIRQGTPTAEYIKKILSRITLMGAFFLAFIAIFPMLVQWILQLCNVSFPSIAFGGTSLLIVVGVIQETARELEAQLTMRNYKGFLD